MKIRPYVILSVLSVIASSPAIPAPAPACPSPFRVLPGAACASSRPATSLRPAVILAQTLLTRAQCEYMCSVNDKQCKGPTLLGVESGCIQIPYESCLPRCLDPNDPLVGNFNALALTLWGRR